MGKKNYTLQPVKGRATEDDPRNVTYTEIFYRRKRVGMICRYEAEDDVKFYVTVGHDFPMPAPRDYPVFASQKDALFAFKRQHKKRMESAKADLVQAVLSMRSEGVLDDSLRNWFDGVRKAVKKAEKKKSEPAKLKKAA